MSGEQIETTNNVIDIDTHTDTNTDNNTNNDDLNDTIENDTVEQLRNILCERVRKEFLDWWDNNRLGEGEYYEMINTVNQKLFDVDLPKKKMTLYKQIYNWGFDFFYAKVEGENYKYLPIPFADGALLAYTWADATHIDEDDNDSDKHKLEPHYVWPIPDFDGNYFIPEYKVKRLEPPSGSMSTDHHLSDMARGALHSNKYRMILTALSPYAEKIAKESPRTYMEITQKIHSFPKDYLSSAEKKVKEDECCIQ